MKGMQRTKDIFVVGFALFAMFLGAANIIFPPFMGAQAGSNWIWACLGFVLTGTGLPVLGVIALAKAGGSADDVSKRVSPRFAQIFNVILVIFIGPLFCVPRTAATTVELSVLPFLPETVSKQAVLLIGSAVFFGICLFFVLSPNSAIDKIGRYLTPLLLIFLLSLIVLAIVRPIATPVAAVIDKPVHYGFTTGYQTMDAMAAIVFGGAIYSSLLTKGYTRTEAQRMMWPVALLCGLGTMTVYLGFAWIGASGSAALQAYSEKTVLTVQAIHLLAGTPGRIMLAAIIFLACCTTAIGLLMTAANVFLELKIFKGRVSYRSMALALTAISYLVSIMGVEGIVMLAAPVLELMYPVVIVLIALNLMGVRIRYDYAFHGALIATLPAAILNILRLFLMTKPFADAWLVHFPLGDAGFGCFIPAIFGAFFGDWLAKSRELKGTLDMRRKLVLADEADTVSPQQPRLKQKTRMRRAS